jgi:calcineurin-like phosphoesterase family protein
LGDVSFTQEGIDMIECLPAHRKILIRGNHDTLPMESYIKVFDEIHGAYRYKGAFFTHIPIHESELYRGYNVHGHCHRGGPREYQLGNEWRAYYNAILEFNDYQLVNMNHILKTLKIIEEE